MLNNKDVFLGWLGGDYEKLGLSRTKEDAVRGLFADDYLHELLEEFKGKKVLISVEVVEE